MILALLFLVQCILFGCLGALGHIYGLKDDQFIYLFLLVLSIDATSFVLGIHYGKENS